MLLFGDASPVVTHAEAAELERLNPRASVVSIAKSGHMIPWDNLEHMAKEIEAFISTLEGVRP